MALLLLISCQSYQIIVFEMGKCGFRDLQTFITALGGAEELILLRGAAMFRKHDDFNLSHSQTSEFQKLLWCSRR